MEWRRGNSGLRFCQPLSAADENDLISAINGFKISAEFFFEVLSRRPEVSHKPRRERLNARNFEKDRSIKSNDDKSTLPSQG